MFGIKCKTNGLLLFCGFLVQHIALHLIHGSKGICLATYTEAMHLKVRYKHVFTHLHLCSSIHTKQQLQVVNI